MALLDHLTRGRVMMGVGPGALVSDAHMLGIESTVQRERMDESLGIIIRLFTETEPISYTSDWFELHDAVVQAQAISEAPHAHRGGRCPIAGRGSAGRQVRGRDTVGQYTWGYTGPDGPSETLVHRRGVGGGARADGTA